MPQIVPVENPFTTAQKTTIITFEDIEDYLVRAVQSTDGQPVVQYTQDGGVRLFNKQYGRMIENKSKDMIVRSPLICLFAPRSSARATVPEHLRFHDNFGFPLPDDVDMGMNFPVVMEVDLYDLLYDKNLAIAWTGLHVEETVDHPAGLVGLEGHFCVHITVDGRPEVDVIFDKEQARSHLINFNSVLKDHAKMFEQAVHEEVEKPD
jgi:hypothetical protein